MGGEGRMANGIGIVTLTQMKTRRGWMFSKMSSKSR
jgi:hypothetical protein